MRTLSRLCPVHSKRPVNPGGMILLDEYNDPDRNKAVGEFLAVRPERQQFIAKDDWVRCYFANRATTAAA
jgi:hypothetical protein